MRIKKILYFLMCSIITIQTTNLMTPNDKIIVSVPIASLWTEPTELHGPYTGALFSKNIPTHDSQLLYGEQATIIESNNQGWIKIQADEQPNFNRIKKTWGWCDGWLQENQVIKINKQLSFNTVVCSQWATLFEQPTTTAKKITQFSIGTLLQTTPINNSWAKVLLLDGTKAYIKKNTLLTLHPRQPLSTNQLRSLLIKRAKGFLNAPYIWGGRSAYNKNCTTHITGVDCSGLTNLVYRSCGLCIARNAHPQYEETIAVEPKHLQPGDLAFIKMSKHEFKRVSHVLLYIGDDLFIEATGLSSSPCKVRTISALNYCGLPLNQINQGMRINFNGNEFELYGGSYLASKDILQKIRNF